MLRTLSGSLHASHGRLSFCPKRKTRFRIFSVFSLIATLGVCSLNQALAQSPGAAQMPNLMGGAMLECAGLPCAEMTTGSGKHFRLLIDTGNESSVLDFTKAKELGLKIEPLLDSDGKPYVNYSQATIKNLRLGDASLGDLRVLIMNLQDTIQKGETPPSDGTISYTAFKDRILQLDYKNRRVSISDRLTAEIPCPSFCGTISNPTFGKKGPPIVVADGFSVNGNPVLVQLDTLYAGTMLIYPTSVIKLGLVDQHSATKTRLFPFTDGGVTMIEGAAAKESFGATELMKNGLLYFATQKVHCPDGMFDGTVGQELFANRVLTLDFHSKHFSIS